MKYGRLLATAIVALCASAVFAQTPTRPDQTVVIQGRREASEASWTDKCIRYIPFRVPAGTTKITIKLATDWGSNKDEKHTLDTGLFDPRGYGLGGPGFRGWQGGSADQIVVTGDRATTGRFYVAGPIYPGIWNIVQRFLKSTTAGLNYTYTITFSFDGPAPPAVAIPVPKCDQGVIARTAGWYPGDMHLHTIHSDGNKTLAESMAQHESQGYRFMVSTDHNTSTAHYDFADAAQQHPKTLLIYGEEWTTGSGHANIVGMRPGSWVDFRVDPGDGKLTWAIDTAHNMGAMFVINHPCSIKWRYPEKEWAKADAIEVWNGGWGADDGQAVELWDRQLQTGRHIAAIGGTDTHGGNARTPATWVCASNLSKAAILDGLHKEHIFVSESPAGPSLLLSAQEEKALPGDTIPTDKDGWFDVVVRVVGGKGMTLRVVWTSMQEVSTVPSDDYRFERNRKMTTSARHGYVRAELVKPDGKMAALTNAIYLDKP